MDHRFEQLAVHQVEPVRIDIEHGQRLVRDFFRDTAIALDFGVIAHPAQQPVGDAWRATGPSCDLEAAGGVHLHLQQSGAARDDARQLFGRVELQPRDDAETVPQRIGEHAGAGGGADQRERLEIELDAARRRTFADHDVDLVVLQRGVKNFLDHRAEAVNLVDEQHVVLFEIGQQRGQVFRLFQHRAGSLAQVHAEFGRDDVAQRRLAEAGRAEQQHMVERLAALSGRADENLQLLAHLGLADILVQ